MSKNIHFIGQVKQQLKHTTVHQWIEGLIRLGFVAKGSIYGTIGLLAIIAIFETNQEIVGTHGLLLKIAAQPWGQLLIGLLIIGLTGYVLRRLIQALFDPKHPGEFNLKRLINRCGYFMSGLTYSGVIYTASQLLIGLDAENDDTIEDLAAELFEQPFGLWLVIIAGIATIGVGFSYLYGAYSGSYIRELNSTLNHQVKRWAIGIGKVGIAARGIGFITIGIFLVQATFLVRSDPAGGLANALKQLQLQPFGSLWLGGIAFGFMAYAIYMFVVALYSRDWI